MIARLRPWVKPLLVIGTISLAIGVGACALWGLSRVPSISTQLRPEAATVRVTLLYPNPSAIWPLNSFACSNGEADFTFIDHALLGERLDPVNGARMSMADHGSAPSKGSCSSEAIVTSPVPLETTTSCYQTSAERWGWIKVNGCNCSTVNFDWGTY